MKIPRHTAVLLLVALGSAAATGCDRVDTASDDVVATYMATSSSATSSSATSSSAATSSAADTLDPGSVEVGYTMGDPDAPIAVVEFSDFGCPYCGRFALTTLPVIHREYIEAGLVRWRYVPIALGFPGGELMGSAALCASDQLGEARFWQVHDLMYRRQVALRGEDARSRIVPWLEELGVDGPALEACIDDPATMRRIEEHTAVARDWYVRATPSFVVNGVPMAGALPVDFFRTVFATVLDPTGL